MPVTTLVLWLFSLIATLALLALAVTQWGFVTVLPFLLVLLGALRWAMAPLPQPVPADDRSA